MRSAAMALVIALSGCCTLADEYVEQERADFDLARGMLTQCWDRECERLTQDQRYDRGAWLDSWNARIEAAEGARGEQP